MRRSLPMWLSVWVGLFLAACPDDEDEAEQKKSAVETTAEEESHSSHEQAGHDEHAEHGDPHAGHAHMKMPSGEALSGESIYQIDSSWTDQHGEQHRLETFRGKIVVLAMVYTHCQFACPRIISDMRRIRDGIDEQKLDELEFVLVSIDPQRDTVERLESFGEEAGLTKQGWTLLRGDPDDVRELAAVFGVQYRKTTETDFAHSNLISVLDREGEIVHQQEGLGVEPDDTLEAIEALLASEPEK